MPSAAVAVCLGERGVGWVSAWPAGVSAWGVSTWPGGCLPSQGVSAWPGRVYLTGGCLPVQGNVCVAQGMSAWPGVVCLARGCLPGQGGCTPPPCGQTDTCENITFPQLLLRTVKIQNSLFS